MRSPSNVILAGIAAADLIVMIEYLPHTITNHIVDLKHCPIFAYRRYQSRGRVVYWLFHICFYFTLRDISTMLHVVLAFWRYRTIR